MRILHVITTLDIGGAERLMVDLLPRLCVRGNSVELLVFNGLESSFEEEIKKNGIVIHELAHAKGSVNHREVYNPLNILRIKRFIKNYDIIHTHNTACQFYVPLSCALWGIRAKLVTTEHNTTNGRRGISWFKPIDMWMYSNYSAIVCISQQTSINLKQYIGPLNRVLTIPNGVNIERFKMPIRSINDEEHFTITMIAAFREQKDHPTLLKALTLLPDNYRLQLVGDGETAPNLKRICNELNITDRVTFMGFRSDVPEILQNTDVTVLSSHWEGFGLAAVEAMASGRPLVASDVGGLRDVVNGAGLLFPHGDEVALAKEIQNLCENPDFYRKVAQACQDRAKKYDINTMADDYLKLYESLIVNSEN